MQVAVALVSESRLDLGAFLPSTENVTGKNHARATDARHTVSQLEADVSILDDFSGNRAKLPLAVTYVGFLFAGLAHDIQEVIEYSRGMAHLHTEYVDPHIRCVLIVGSLDQWHKSIVESCKAHQLSTARSVFNKVYLLLGQKGLSRLFDLKTTGHSDGTLLIQ